MTHYVYVLAARSGNGRVATYVGWTLDLERRLAEHNGVGSRGAKSTRGRNWILLYAERYQSKGAAMAREYALKNDRKFRAQLRSP
jgi:putative endonuclease